MDFEKSDVCQKYNWWAKLCARCLQTGVNYPLKGIVRATEIASASNEQLDEKHWEQAANELGIANRLYNISF